MTIECCGTAKDSYYKGKLIACFCKLEVQHKQGSMSAQTQHLSNHILTHARIQDDATRMCGGLAEAHCKLLLAVRQYRWC